jgi:hypothetical protein
MFCGGVPAITSGLAKRRQDVVGGLPAVHRSPAKGILFEELGFSSESSLYHAFRSYHGCTPREYALRARTPCEKRGPKPSLRARSTRQPLEALEHLQKAARCSTKLTLYYVRSERARKNKSTTVTSEDECEPMCRGPVRIVGRRAHYPGFSREEID